MNEQWISQPWSISSDTAAFTWYWDALMAELPDLTDDEREAIAVAREAVGTAQQDQVDEATLRLVFGAVRRYAELKQADH